MGWIFFVLLQGVFVYAGIRHSQRAGLWSWSKFFFALAFAALECLLVLAPIYFFRVITREFWIAFIAAWIVAAANFIWFTILARCWKLPDGRTSLQADRDQRQ
jgi:hypothetical protein